MPKLNISTQPVTIQGIRKWLVKSVASLVIYGMLLFLSAGRLDWIEGWAYFGIIFLTQIFSAVVLIPRRPDLIAERSKLQEGTKKWDLFLAPVIAILGPLAMIVTAGLDARLGWSVPMDIGLWLLGLALVLGSGMFGLWAMASNPFFAATVRIQEDRGQTVVRGGPYRLVRHPGYLGSIIFNLATPLALGSRWTYLPALVIFILLLVRTGLGDRTLRDELSGYSEYSTVTRYRLIPGVW
ncbi:MAG: methyltransferase family protein [Bacteroidota bacterium]